MLSHFFRESVGLVGVAFLRISLAVARKKGEVDGIPVVALSAKTEIPEVEKLLGETMRLLSSKLPRYYRRVQRFVDHFAIWDGLHCATNRCHGVMIDLATLRAPTAELASMLVHEATHLRLQMAGVRSTFASRPRLERVCNQEADWVHLQLTNTPSRSVSKGVFHPSASQIREYRRRHSIALATKLGLPSFVGKAIAWLRDG